MAHHFLRFNHNLPRARVHRRRVAREIRPSISMPFSPATNAPQYNSTLFCFAGEVRGKRPPPRRARARRVEGGLFNSRFLNCDWQSILTPPLPPACLRLTLLYNYCTSVLRWVETHLSTLLSHVYIRYTRGTPCAMCLCCVRVHVSRVEPIFGSYWGVFPLRWATSDKRNTIYTYNMYRADFHHRKLHSKPLEDECFKDDCIWKDPANRSE